MLRLALFFGTNIAVLAVMSIVFQVLGLEQWLAQSGTQLNLTGLLIFSAVFGMTGSLISLAMSKTLAIRGTGAKVITQQPRGPTERWLVNTVRRQAEAAGIGMPDVAVFDAPEMNAFATGMRRDHALVAVSTGLLRGMREDEVEAVLAHEVSHVANGDMITMGLLQGVLNTFVIFFSRIIGFVVDRLVFRNERGYGPGFWIASIFAQVVLGILASMIAMWFSRRREFRADAGGAALAGQPKMVSALRSLARSYGQSSLPESVEAFGISGRVAGGLQRLLMSHPPLEERIAALEKSEKQKSRKKS
ncbi:MAG: protease HtpX [Xanthomonadales bacterium]|nr:protease HtpX [Xanthomonadales bacterium]